MSINDSVRSLMGYGRLEENSKGIFLASHKKLTGTDGVYYPADGIKAARIYVINLVRDLNLDKSLHSSWSNVENTLNYLIKRYDAFYMFKPGSSSGSVHKVFYFGGKETEITKVQALKIEKVLGITDSDDKIMTFDKFSFGVNLSSGNVKAYSDVFDVK